LGEKQCHSKRSTRPSHQACCSNDGSKPTILALERFERSWRSFRRCISSWARQNQWKVIYISLLATLVSIV